MTPHEAAKAAASFQKPVSKEMQRLNPEVFGPGQPEPQGACAAPTRPPESSQATGRAPAAPFRVFIACLPPTATAQQKGVGIVNGKPKFYTKKRLREAKENLIGIFSPNRPASPFIGPIRVTIRFHYPWRVSEGKETMRRFQSYPIEQRPDIDNISKLATDVLTECGYWQDDSQISTLIASKYRGDVTGIEIAIEREDGTPRTL